MADVDARSVIKARPAANRRKVREVPFVEMYGNRVQGVVSSSSDIERVYVSYFEAGTLNFNCSTNNNRPCSGLRGGPCKHLMSLLNEAALQFGAPQVAAYLKIEADPATLKRGSDIARYINGHQHKEEAGLVFSRFLSYLNYIELEGAGEPIPEMSWFVSG
jgi:hypothetical protein